MGDVSDLALERLSADALARRYLDLDRDPRFQDFPGTIEINEFGDLIMNAASRPHVLLQKRLGDDLERQLGGEAVTEMPVRVALPDGAGFRIRVPDIAWSGTPGFFDSPEHGQVLTRPAELCVEVKSESNTLRDLYEKRDELLGAGAREVWIVFPGLGRAEYFAASGRVAASSYGIDVERFLREQGGGAA